MITLILQCLVGVLALTFGILAFRVAQSQHAGSAPQRLSWTVVAVAFAVGGISNSLYNIGAVSAFVSGAGSTAWITYLRWSPAGNYAGAFVKSAMAIIVMAIALRRVHKPNWKRGFLIAVLLTAYLAGSLVGYLEGSHEQSIHYPNLAALEMVEVIALLGGLFAGLVRNSMDRHLWICISLYTFRQVLNVLFWSALSWISVAGAWSPHPAHVQVYAVAGYVLMIVVVSHRLSLARRGIQVSGLLDSPTRTHRSLIG